MIKALRTEADWRHILAESSEKPVLLFKHSTRCGVSASAAAEIDQLVDLLDSVKNQVSIYRLLVVEDRPLSQLVARETNVPHQSPQTMLLHQGRPVWHTSHWAISVEKLKQAITTHLQTLQG